MLKIFLDKVIKNMKFNYLGRFYISTVIHQDKQNTVAFGSVQLNSELL